jgi:hypothetical protein
VWSETSSASSIHVANVGKLILLTMAAAQRKDAAPHLHRQITTPLTLVQVVRCRIVIRRARKPSSPYQILSADIAEADSQCKGRDIRHQRTVMERR